MVGKSYQKTVKVQLKWRGNLPRRCLEYFLHRENRTGDLEWNWRNKEVKDYLKEDAGK